MTASSLIITCLLKIPLLYGVHHIIMHKYTNVWDTYLLLDSSHIVRDDTELYLNEDTKKCHHDCQFSIGEVTKNLPIESYISKNNLQEYAGSE